MLFKKIHILVNAVILLCFITGCKKYLDKKPIKTLVVPGTLKDLQAILDNSAHTNQSTPGIAELLADNYYVTTSDWQSLLSADQRNNYLWDKEAFDLESWQAPYKSPIYYSNVVLDVLNDIEVNDANRQTYNSIKGSALFYRAFAFLQVAQIYCLPYSAANAEEPGIVLKLSSSINEKYTRSTVQQTYDQIIADLKTALDLVPATTIKPTRPNKSAVYGLLARTYLSMSDYENAGHYADLGLQQNNSLMDFNTITSIPNFNTEITYYNVAGYYDILFPPIARIDSNLYDSYSDDDLRKTLFFIPNGDGTYSFNGSYAGIVGVGFAIFDGITTAEMYLIRAECNARAGNTADAMADLNTLMVSRWKNNGSWVPFTASDAAIAKNIILSERRKELVYRTLRWSDIRRLNLEGANITLTRIINGTTYTLPPNDLRSVMLIAPQEINLSGITQNKR